MKTFLITQQEPFYIFKVAAALINNETHEIVGATVLKGKRVNKSRWSYLKERIAVYTLWELLWVTWAYFLCKLKGRKIERLLSDNGIAVIKTEDVNDPVYVEHVKATGAEVILSISPPQLFKKQLLKAVPYCLNAHASLLPRHRGVFGTWWALYHGDNTTGITIHTMDEQVDKGKIVMQKKINIKANETQFSLAYRTKQLIAPALIECMDRLEEDKLHPITPTETPSYNYAPSKKDNIRFRNKGLKVFRLGDLKHMLSARF